VIFGFGVCLQAVCEGFLSGIFVRCCPGGFPCYILTKNAQAKGVGISLPAKEGGYRCILRQDLQTRIEIYYANITVYQLGPTVATTGKVLKDVPRNIWEKKFDLALFFSFFFLSNLFSVGAKPYDRDVDTNVCPYVSSLN
jgi:hypothetical protein